MHTRGDVAPASEVEAGERFERVGRLAQVAVREAATAMGFDREEYDERVTPDVVEQVRNALFATPLEVHVGTRDEFEAWEAAFGGEVVVVGSEHVDNVAWHETPAGTAVAATFQDEEDAAVETLRRQAFGRVYRDLLEATQPGEDGTGET